MHGSGSRAEVAGLLLSLVALAPARAAAQQGAPSSLHPLEARIDAIDVRSPESGIVQIGAGVNVPLGYYVRLEIDGAGGVAREDGVNHNSGRADAVARFLLDPFNETRWGISVGGGVSVRFAEADRLHEYLVVVLDLEAPRVRGVVPALQLGLGGGVRVGIVARQYRAGRR